MSMTKKKNRNEGFKDKHRAADSLVIALESRVQCWSGQWQFRVSVEKAAGESGTILPLSHLLQHLGCNFFMTLTQI